MYKNIEHPIPGFGILTSVQKEDFGPWSTPAHRYVLAIIWSHMDDDHRDPSYDYWTELDSWKISNEDMESGNIDQQMIDEINRAIALVPTIPGVDYAFFQERHLDQFGRYSCVSFDIILPAHLRQKETADA